MFGDLLTGIFNIIDQNITIPCALCQKKIKQSELVSIHCVDPEFSNPFYCLKYDTDYFFKKFNIFDIQSKYRFEEKCFCPECAKKQQETLENEIQQATKAIKSEISLIQKRLSSIRIFSINYQGNVIYDRNIQNHISSSAFKSKNDALEHLKLIAIIEKDCDLIYNVEYISDTMSEPSIYGRGTHYYTGWTAKGIATKNTKK